MVNYHAKPRFVLGLALLAVIAFSFAARAITMTVPAVDENENGILTTITINSSPGDGNILLELKTATVSTDTQDSIRTAIEEGAKIAGVDEGKFNFDVSFDDSIGKVNGPSAGATMALMAYSELSGVKIRPDYIMTGTIVKGGSIGPVGGVKSKIDAAGKDGRFHVMAVPAGQPEELGDNILDSVFYPDYAKQTYGFDVVLVSNLSYAVKLATGQINPPQNQTSEVFVPQSYGAISSSIPFRDIASKVMTDSVTSGDLANLTAMQRQAMERLIADARIQSNSGYYYTAANTAFLIKTAVDTSNFQYMTGDEFARVATNLQSEMSSFQFAAMNSTNWEYQVAAQMRFQWASYKLAGVLSNLTLSTPAKQADDLSAAINWFEAAKSLNNANVPFSQARLPRPQFEAKSEAKSYLDLVESDINKSQTTDSDILFHFGQSRILYNAGDYFAAMIDASYSYSYLEASKSILRVASESSDAFGDTLSMENGAAKLLSNYPSFSDESKRSVFADLFFANSNYYSQLAAKNNDYSALINAYKLVLLSGSMQIVSDYVTYEQSSPVIDIPAMANASSQNTNETGGSGIIVTINTPVPTEDSSAGHTNIKTSVKVTQGSPSDYSSLGLVLAGAGLITLIAAALMGGFFGKPKFSSEADLDRLLLEGKISPDSYERLRKRYFPIKTASLQQLEGSVVEEPHAVLPSQVMRQAAGAQASAVLPKAAAQKTGDTQKQILPRQKSGQRASMKLNRSFQRPRR